MCTSIVKGYLYAGRAKSAPRHKEHADQQSAVAKQQRTLQGTLALALQAVFWGKTFLCNAVPHLPKTVPSFLTKNLAKFQEIGLVSPLASCKHTMTHDTNTHSNILNQKS